MTALLILTGCGAQKQFIALPQETKKEIQSTDIYLLDCQDKMHFDVENSNVSGYTGGGLLFALIDGAIMEGRKNDAEKALVPLQEVLKNIDVQEYLNSALIPSLKESEWLKAQDIHHVKNINNDELKEVILKTKSDAVLVTHFNYRLSHDFKKLTGAFYVTLYPASDRLKTLLKIEDPLKEPLFKTHVILHENLKNCHDDIQKNADLWSVNDAFYLKDAIKNLIHRLTANLEKQIQNPEAIETK